MALLAPIAIVWHQFWLLLLPSLGLSPSLTPLSASSAVSVVINKNVFVALR